MSLLLLAGVVRVLLWGVGMWIAIRQKRRIFAAAFGLATTSSAVFAFSNAGVTVPVLLFDYAVLVSTPIVALLVMGLADHKEDGDRWTWW